MSQCSTGLARERKVCPVSDGRIRTSAPITPIRRLPGDSAPLGVIDTAVTRGRKEFHSMAGWGPVCKDQSLKKKSKKKTEGLGENRLGRGPKFPYGELRSYYVLNLGFKL